MSYPKVGMHFEDVRKRVKRIMNNAPNTQAKVNLVNSLVNQSRLCDGEGAANEIIAETDTNNHSGNKLGYSKRYERNFENIFCK